ncbi:hypothetical protein TSUD_336990 [Trifolium subterraneum]|uniref:Uncharacterized protein n=1 Tax=Trifolium subterraneum TaxID=3900 RepID=A0A2Z6LUE7_TRISU|nr:hypothetical protein TSUD_336990 [Trifolium subterraneum]
MQANAEIKKYEDTVKNLYNMLKKVSQERDEARDQLQHLITNFQPSTPDKTHSTINTKVDPSCELSLSSLQSNEKKKNSSIVESCNLALPKQKNYQNQNKFGMVKASFDGVVSSSLSLCSIQEESYLSSNTYDKESVNLDESVPTYLSLAFPGNSSGASQMSHGMNNHTISAKKRKFL